MALGLLTLVMTWASRMKATYWLMSALASTNQLMIKSWACFVTIIPNISFGCAGIVKIDSRYQMFAYSALGIFSSFPPA
jgi:hypothetical protein